MTQQENITKAQAAFTQINTNFSYLAGEVERVENAIPTTVAELTDSGDYALKADVASAIIPHGSVAAISGMAAPSANTLGWMYNFTAEFTTTADFAEGAGKKFPAGTDVVIIDNGTGSSHDYKYNVFAGFQDTSAYDNHIANADIHTTASEKLANSQHIANGDIHVTAAQKTAWTAKQDALTFDNTPTASSNNPVKSGGVYSALALKANAADVYTKTEIDSYIDDLFDVSITPLNS